MLDIQIKPYQLALSSPYHWAKGTITDRQGLIVRADINNNHIGWGEISPPLNSSVNIQELLKNCNNILRNLKINTENFLDELDKEKIEPSVRYGISSAIYTAKANLEHKTLAEYLIDNVSQGYIPELPRKIPINLLAADSDLNSFLQSLKNAANAKQNTIKIKCTSDNSYLLEKLELTRHYFPQAQIRLDPNQSWTLQKTLEILEQISNFNIDYIEDPLPEHATIEQYTQLSAQSNIPIAIDEPINSITDVKQIVANKACKVLILKPQRIGGIDRVIEIINLARKSNLRCVITSSIETSIGIQLGLSCAAYLQEMLEPCGLGTSNFFNNNITQPHKILNGYIAIPQLPGLGINPQSWWSNIIKN